MHLVAPSLLAILPHEPVCKARSGRPRWSSRSPCRQACAAGERSRRKPLDAFYASFDALSGRYRGFYRLRRPEAHASLQRVRLLQRRINLVAPRPGWRGGAEEPQKMAICFGIVFLRSFRAAEPTFTGTASEARILGLRAYRLSSSRYQLRLRRATRAELEGVPGGEMLAVARSIEAPAQHGPARLVEPAARGYRWRALCCVS